MRALPLLLIPLALSGCRTLMDPTFVPTSYAHHHEYYKAPPGPEADYIGYNYSEAKNDKAVGEFLAAATDIVATLEQESGLQPQTILIENRLKDSAFNNSYDYALREAFRTRGYTLANPSEAYESRVTFEAISSKNQPPQMYSQFLKKNNKIEDFDLVLNLYEGENLPQTISKTYSLPNVGYKASGQLKPEDRNPSYRDVADVRTRNFRIMGEND